MIYRIVFDYDSRTLVRSPKPHYTHKLLRGYCGTMYASREEAEIQITARNYPKQYYKNVRVEEE